MGKFMETCLGPVGRDSSIHGMKYLSQPNRPCWERGIWFLIILISTGCSCYWIYIIFQKFLESPVIVSFQPSDTTIGDIPFPAVTICNNNRFRKSTFENELRSYANGSEEQRNGSNTVLRAMDHVCSLGNPFHREFNYSGNETTLNLCQRLGIGCSIDYSADRFHAGMEFDERLMGLLLAFPLCEDLIPLCVWGGEKVDCGHLFAMTFTDMGMCCTFNMMPRDKLLNLAQPSPIDRYLNQNETAFWTGYGDKFDKLLQAEPGSESDILLDHRKHLKFQTKAGQVSGLSVLLDLNPDEYFCSGSDSFGFRVLTHSVIEPPNIARYGIQIAPNSETYISVSAEVTRTEPGVKLLETKRRQCFFSDEHPLDSFNVYTGENCIRQCLAESVAIRCNCTRLDLPLKFAKGELKDTSYCEGVGFKCASDQEVNFTKIGIEGACKDKKCLPSCSKIHYKAQTSSLPLRADFSVDARFQEKQGLKIGKNVSIVHVFFGSDNVYSRVRKQLYGMNDFFAQIGGILGLYLGMSFLSLAELVNILFKAVANRRSPDRKDFKNDVVNQEMKPRVVDWTKAWDWEGKKDDRKRKVDVSSQR